MRTNLKLALLLPLILLAGLMYAQLQVVGDAIVSISPGTTVVGIEPAVDGQIVESPLITVTEGTQIVGNFYVAGEAIHFEEENSKELIVEKVNPEKDSVDFLLTQSGETEESVIEPIRQEEEELPLILVQHKSSSGFEGGVYLQHSLILPTPSSQKANLTNNELNLTYFLNFYKEVDQYIVTQTSHGFTPGVDSRPPPFFMNEFYV